jgi:hypothetical protein
VGKEEIDIVAKKNSISLGEEKSISRRRKNRYRREEKINIAAKKKSISPRRKIDYRVEEKRDIAAKKNRLSRQRKNRYCGEGRSRCC